jgi:hypothetical protein
MPKPRFTAAILRGLAHAMRTCPLTWQHVARQHGPSTLLADVTKAAAWLDAMEHYRDPPKEP